MVLKKVIGMVFAGALVFSAGAADLVIRLAPPRVVVERRTPPPSRDHVWIQGYQRWDGEHYNWTPGRWEQRPTPRSRWVAHHYVHQKGGYVLVEGHWR